MSSTFSFPIRVRRAPGAAFLAAILALGCNRDHAAIAAEIEKGVEAVRTENIDAYMAQIDDAALSPDSAVARHSRDIIRTSVLDDWSKTTTRSINVEVESVDSEADSAIVTSTLRWDRIVQRPMSTDTVVSKLQHRELWRRTAKGWRPFKVLWTGGTNTTNGREERVNRGG